jgi:hypothetical protein
VTSALAASGIGGMVPPAWSFVMVEVWDAAAASGKGQDLSERRADW